MEENTTDPKRVIQTTQRKHRKKFSLRRLRLSLRYRPEILKLVLKMRQCIKKKNSILKKLKHQLIEVQNKIKETFTKNANKDIETDHSKTIDTKNSSTQTTEKLSECDNVENKPLKAEEKSEAAYCKADNSGWELKPEAENKPLKTEEKSEAAYCKAENSGWELKPEAENKPIKAEEKSEAAYCKTDDSGWELKPKAENKPVKTEEKSEAAYCKADNSGWELKPDEEGKSIADQVKEAAQSALQQSGMVYVESAGMYYDYKTGYYYNSELGLYYHTDTNCYYYYNDDKKEFAFHSYPDRSAVAVNPSLEAHEKRKARKQRKGDGPRKAKRRKKEKKSKKETATEKKSEDTETLPTEMESEETEASAEKDTKEKSSETVMEADGPKDDKKAEGGDGDVKNGADELEDGECSDTASEQEESSDEESNASTASLGDNDTVAKHHPPCMRVIVRETTLPKLKVGSLFLITKDGGTVGREGEQHTILLRDANVSRNHLEIKYDMSRRMYTATDLGSKNGSFLNGVLMAESQVVSVPMEVMHGSILQLGETKLLCHIHPGNDTCGHCEPGLIMETQEKEKVAYTRTCNVKKQYELELARLKNKYKPEPLMIEDGSYTDRAKARREAVGSSHSSEKTQSTDTETHIAPENKGFKLLEKMGWSKGEGLGKDNQGDTAPIPLVSNEGKVGLGGAGAATRPGLVPLPKVRNTLGPATLRLATKSKLLQAPAKVFQDNDEEESE